MSNLAGLRSRVLQILFDSGGLIWSDADIDEIAPRIHVGAERIRREDWVGQAQAATRGG